MELRVLKYFLTVAQEENITKAAKLLHITQPTLSRQLMSLEEKLGVQLFYRSRHKIMLTEDGLLLKRRAGEITELSEKTISELSHNDAGLSGEISIGCGETMSMDILAKIIFSFREKYPQVRFDIYSAIADDVKERLERGALDMGLFVEPVDIDKYDFIRMPEKEKWGVIVPDTSELAKKEFLIPKDLAEVPVMMSKRSSIRNELANWFGDYYDKLNIVSSFNLTPNAAMLVKNNIGVAVSLDLPNKMDGLSFVPLYPVLETYTVVAWKRHQEQSRLIKGFIHHIKKCLKGI